MESTTDELQHLSLKEAFVTSDDEEEAAAAEPQVHLAFLEEPDGPEELQRHRFPNKAGGAPAWLDPVSLPSGESRLCGFCGEPLRFALQVYAPFPTAYHRTLFVFMCPAMSCLLLDREEQAAGIGRRRRRSDKVFRCQLPRDNAFYSCDDDESDTTACTGVAAAPLCNWCGTWKAETACAGGGGAKYCSEKHEEEHVSSGCSCDVVASSGQDASSASGSGQEGVPFAGVVWPEYAMYTRPEEPPDRDADDTTPTSSSAQDPAGHIVDDAADDDDTAAWMADFVEEEDTTRWAAFRARFSSAGQRGQVLRYCSEDGARPLWAAASGSLPDAGGDSIPSCAHCGGAMLYEMQLMPQLLHYFRVETHDPDPLNWATIVVYTCARSCDGERSGEGGGYREEFAWVQLHAATTDAAGMEAEDEE